MLITVSLYYYFSSIVLLNQLFLISAGNCIRWPNSYCRVAFSASSSLNSFTFDTKAAFCPLLNWNNILYLLYTKIYNFGSQVFGSSQWPCHDGNSEVTLLFFQLTICFSGFLLHFNATVLGFIMFCWSNNLKAEKKKYCVE